MKQRSIRTKLKKTVSVFLSICMLFMLILTIPVSAASPALKPTSGAIYVNNVDLLNTDMESYPQGISYSYNDGVNVVTVSGAAITEGYVNGGILCGIYAMNAGDLEVVVTGENTINIPNQDALEGRGIEVMGGNLTISGTGSLTTTTGGTAIHADGHGANAGIGKITFKDSVTVNSDKDIRSEDNSAAELDIYVNDTVNITCNGIQCSNNNTPTVASGATFNNLAGSGSGSGGGEGGGIPPSEPFNLLVGGVSVVSGGAIQPENIDNLEIVYSEMMHTYILYLTGGTYDGIYCEGTENIRIYVQRDAVINNLAMDGYTDYSIVLKNGGEILGADFMYNYDEQSPPPAISYLQLNGGLMAGNRLDFKDTVAVTIGSSEARVNKGIVGFNNSVYLDATNKEINIWAAEFGMQDVNNQAGCELGSAVTININSNGVGADNTNFQVGEGSSLNMNYSSRGTFTSNIYNWDYMDMTGPIESYANRDSTMISNLVEGTNVDGKYIYSDQPDSYQLTSTAKPLYALGYNYDNDMDGIVDNPDEEILNGQLSIKGATGVCWVSSDGFTDYHFEAGTIVTIELLPDYGYQYKAGSLGANGQPIDTTPQETKAVYTFVMPEGNVHLVAGFESKADTIVNNSTSVATASIAVGGNDIHGNVEFVVNTDTPSTSEAQAIAGMAGTKTVGTYVDLTLNEIITKAGTSDAWTTSLTQLSEPVTVSLSLDNSLCDNTDYSIIKIHDGVATELNATYSNGSVTFDTNQFSTYAIIYKRVIPNTTVTNVPVTATPTPTPTVTPTPNPKANAPLLQNSDGTTGWDAVISEMADGITESLQTPNTQTDPVSFTIEMNGSTVIPQKVFEQMQGQNVSVTFDMGSGISWTINGNNITDQNLQDIDLNVIQNTDNVPKELINQLVTSNGTNNIIISQLALTYSGSFGFSAILSIDLTEQIEKSQDNEMRDNLIAYLYYYNPETHQMELQSIGRIDADGKTTFTFKHASDYAILLKDSLVISDEVLKQIKVNGSISGETSKKTIYAGGSLNKGTVKINLPQPIQDAVNKGIADIKTSFVSSDKSIATVSSRGVITAKKSGKAYITTSLTVEGKKLRFKTLVTVKNAYIKFSKSNDNLIIGKKLKYTLTLYGYQASDIIWATAKRKIAIVGKNKGKLSAFVYGKSVGIDYVTVKVMDMKGNPVLYKSKIVVK